MAIKTCGDECTPMCRFCTQKGKENPQTHKFLCRRKKVEVHPDEGGDCDAFNCKLSGRTRAEKGQKLYRWSHSGLVTKDDMDGGLLVAADEEEARLRAEHSAAHWASCGLHTVYIEHVAYVDGYKVTVKPAEV